MSRDPATTPAGRWAPLLLAAALLSAAWPAAAETFGRLFTTPEERARLERLRHAPPVVEVAEPEPEPVAELPEVELPPPPPPPPIPEVTVRGVVTRSSGNNAAWVNDANTLEGELLEQGLRVRRDRIHSAGVAIDLPDHEITVTLKPGEFLRAEDRQVVDPVRSQPPLPAPAHR